MADIVILVVVLPSCCVCPWLAASTARRRWRLGLRRFFAAAQRHTVQVQVRLYVISIRILRFRCRRSSTSSAGTGSTIIVTSGTGHVDVGWRRQWLRCKQAIYQWTLLESWIEVGRGVLSWCRMDSTSDADPSIGRVPSDRTLWKC